VDFSSRPVYLNGHIKSLTLINSLQTPEAQGWLHELNYGLSNCRMNVKDAIHLNSKRYLTWLASNIVTRKRKR